MSSSSTRLSTPQGPGSVSGAPNLPAGFTDTFTSRYIDTGALRQHAVNGGDGPPLLLVHGWPENRYAWRLVMPALARDFTVIAVDQRGIGLTDKPQDGYDSGTLMPLCTTSVSSPTPRSCAAASGSIAPGTPPWPRTSSARAGR
jgi:pimeloyl-ACP methyl ester carboxylesterase